MARVDVSGRAARYKWKGVRTGKGEVEEVEMVVERWCVNRRCFMGWVGGNGGI